jgi:predicted aldo/keto reductase-like oxidoreductase
MKIKELGKTGLKVSELGFGGIPIIPLGVEEAVTVVRHCFDLGITFFDTANMYGDSESKIGQALEKVRGKVVLATKTLDQTYEGAAGHIDQSLENLKTDTIDLYQLHNISKEADLDQILAKDGALEAVKEAQAAGKIKVIGFSSHDIATATRICRMDLFSTIQFPFNFIEHDPADELFKAAKKSGMGIIAMKPLGGGLLERADLCFKFLQQFPDVIPIPGIQSREEMDEITALYQTPTPLSQTDRADIEKIQSQLGKRFCHRCGYCLPCEQGVMITEVMAFRSMARRLAPSIAVMIGQKAMDSVELCTECGECLEKCPYSLPIPDVLRENLSAFGEVADNKD